MESMASTSGHWSSPSRTHNLASSRFEIQASKYRVGAPAPLPPPSMHWSAHKSSERLITRFEDSFLDKAFEVLEKHEVDFDDIDFGVFGRPGEHHQLALQITADWVPEVVPEWKKVVCDLKVYVDDEIEKSGLFDPSGIVVEIIDPLLVKPKIVGPILDNKQLEAEWPVIQDKVFSILESEESTKGTMNAIAIFRFGPFRENDRNPITVFISVNPGASGSAWPRVQGIIQEYLDTFPHELTVRIEHNTIDFCAFDLLTPDQTDSVLAPRPAYQERINFGGEIGPTVYLFDRHGNKRNSGLGTLGCYVEVRTKKVPTWSRYALTNYHVIRPCFDGFRLISDNQKDGKSAYDEKAAPTEGSCCWKADMKGFDPTRPPRRHEVEAPSRRTHNLLVNDILMEMETLKEEFPHQPEKLQPAQEELESRLAFFDNDRNRLGSLWAGSGFSRRSAGNQRLDWALVQVEEGRQGTNMLPPSSTWGHHINRFVFPKAFNVPLKQSTFHSIRDMESGDLVYKYGAATGYTSGTYHKYKPKCRIKHDKYMGMRPSGEYMFIPHEMLKPGGFASNGDSGSVVFTKFGHIIGLLFTGQKPTEAMNTGYALITPIEDVMADIKTFSNGEITDIRISPW